MSVDTKRQLIEVDHPQLSVRRQCALLGLLRSSLYSQPRERSDETLHLMRLLDAQYTATPFYGMRRMTAWLRRRGAVVNHPRVRRRLRTMGLAAIYPKPRRSQPAEGQTIDPSLLRGVTVDRINQGWSAAITYIR